VSSFFQDVGETAAGVVLDVLDGVNPGGTFKIGDSQGQQRDRAVLIIAVNHKAKKATERGINLGGLRGLHAGGKAKRPSSFAWRTYPATPQRCTYSA
jgi:hypothetical protein